MARAPERRGVITIYGFSVSGNCHKVRLLLEQLERPYRWVEVNSAAGETQTPAFLTRNPSGKVPVLELEDGRVLPESNAILSWLADGTPYLPEDRWERAQVLRWMFFEQYSHEPYVAVSRFICGWTPPDSPRRADLPRLRERAHQALAVMERHLGRNRWFTGAGYGIADIALFAYTSVAPHGGVSLDGYPAIRDWLVRIASTPRFIPVPEPDAAAAALIAQSA